MSIILLTPLAPHLSAELWSAFSSMKYKNYEGFLWEKSVFHQVRKLMTLNSFFSFLMF
jgi:hypothetical protein